MKNVIMQVSITVEKLEAESNSGEKEEKNICSKITESERTVDMKNIVTHVRQRV